MADTDVSADDVREAARFAQTYLLNKIPDGDFTEGTPNYDFSIQALAYLFAYMRKKITATRNRSSLITLGQLPEEESVSDAADAILANLFAYRKGGQFSRGPAVLHFAARATVQVSRNTRFFRTDAHVFYLEQTTDLLISPDQLQENRDAFGRVTDYTYVVRVKASHIGSEYVFQPGLFRGADRFSPYLTKVEHTVPLSDGENEQSTQQFIDRSRTAMSLRAMINARSNEATLFERSDDVAQVVTIGYGDPEMSRDLVTEPTSGIRLHVGGHVDVYARMPVAENTFTGVLGALYARPDNRHVILRDEASPVVRNFLTGLGMVGGRAVVPGDVIFVEDGIPEAPFEFHVRSVAAHELVISGRTPFSVGTDEAGFIGPITVSIGNIWPLFRDKLAGLVGTDLVTSRRFSTVNGLVLNGGQVYRVKSIEVFDPSSTYDAYKDPVTNTLKFTGRVNALPVAALSPGDELPFKVTVLNPTEGQSSQSVTVLELGWVGMALDGLNAVVTYDTLSGAEAQDSFIRDPDQRVSAANVLLKGQHPVYLSMNIPYDLSVVRDPFRGNTAATFDEDSTRAQLLSYLNNYQLANLMNTSTVSTWVKQLGAGVSAVYPFPIQYELLASDGKVFRYETTDLVTVFPSGSNGARLLNPADFGLPPTGYEAALKRMLQGQSVSDRTIRYIAATEDLSFERRV